MSSITLRDGLLVCMGNPLLDIIVSADEQLLNKYDLKPNNAILAEEKHKTLYEELVNNYPVSYVAGGASQNTARITEKILKKSNVVIFMGCVGRDTFSEILKEKAKEDGVNVRYQYTEKKPTGTCAVILTNGGQSRSLCANLAAATAFTINHIKEPENSKIIEDANYYYVTGFFLIVSPDTALELARKAAQNNKLFILNLSASYICFDFKQHLLPLLPYIDILFGNETEATAFSQICDFGTTDVAQIALTISEIPKNNQRKRLVIITQGENPVIAARDGVIKQFPVKKLPAEKIIDTNGAGDAFVGGFLAQLIQEQPYEICVKCGLWAAAEVVQQLGCVFNSIDTFIPDK